MPCTAKKTTRLIIEGGNDYVITVKGNQPRLLTQLKTIATGQKSSDRFVDIEKIRGPFDLSHHQCLHRPPWHRPQVAWSKELDSNRTHRHPLRREIFTGQLLH